MPFLALLAAVGVYYLVLNMNKDYENLQIGGGIIIGVLGAYALSSIFHFSTLVTILVFFGIAIAAPVTMSEIRYKIGRYVYFRAYGRTWGLNAAQAEEQYFRDARAAHERGEPFEAIDYEAYFYRRKYY